MSSLNKAILIGRLGHDAEQKTIASGKKVTTFSVATSQSISDGQGGWKDDTQWHNVVVWGDYLSDRSAKFMKGDLVEVSGMIKHRKYTNKDNLEVWVTEIFANECAMFMRAPDNKGKVPAAVASTAAPATQYQKPAADEADDDLPF